MNRVFFLFLIAFFLTSTLAAAQASSLAISYSTSEKSKDSHSTKETYSLVGNTMAYAVKHTGRRGPAQKDMEKTCVFTNSQAESIYQKISEKHLDVTDSLIFNWPGNISPSSSVAITLTLTKGNKISKIKIKGSPDSLKDKTLYKNTVSLIYFIKPMVEDCR